MATQFYDQGAAIEYARRTAKYYSRHFPEDYKEMPTEKLKGWVFHADYSCESDSVTVIRTTPETWKSKPQPAPGPGEGGTHA